MDEEEEKKEDHATLLMFKRRATIFAEEAIYNMIDIQGPIETLNFLAFWMNQIETDPDFRKTMLDNSK